MPAVEMVLFVVALILFFGYFAEFLFNKTGIPDILLLILFGITIGPSGLSYITADKLEAFAPLFTTFTLLFLLFDGAFEIDLGSFARGLAPSLLITLFNFAMSVASVFVVMALFGFSVATSLLMGFILAGISSAFVIPIIKKLPLSKEVTSILTLESALTDVLCIVGALTTLEVIKFSVLDLRMVFSSVAGLFAIAGLIGIVAGIIWIIVVLKVLKGSKSYVITIAYVILVYVITEYLQGNGAIAALFLGLVLGNSKRIINLFGIVAYGKDQQDGISVITPVEEYFYSQISFFLKTFFFVYVGILFVSQDIYALIICLVLAGIILLARRTNQVVTSKYSPFDQAIMSSLFGPGLAAAAIAQVVLMSGIQEAQTVSHIVYIVIGFTIILSSISIFITEFAYKNKGDTNAQSRTS